jgi:hypothetical protein
MIGNIAAEACVFGVAFVQLAAFALVHRNVRAGLLRNDELPFFATEVED